MYVKYYILNMQLILFYFILRLNIILYHMYLFYILSINKNYK